MNHSFTSFSQRMQVLLIYYCKYLNALLLTVFFLGIFVTAASAQSCPLYPSPHLRIGFNFATEGNVGITDYDAARLGAGWYNDYRFQSVPVKPEGILYYQTVRGRDYITPGLIQQLLNSLAPVVDANPGQVWLLGNEPDNVTLIQRRPFFQYLPTVQR